MSRFVRALFGALLSLWLANAQAADAVRAGEYVLSGDHGWLKVQRQGGKTLFSIESVGGNCHSCGLSGRLTGTMAQTVDEDPAEADMACRIRMAPSPDGSQVTVEPLTAEACRQYCGARAAFDGVYRKPQALCTKARQRQARNSFIRNYRAKQFAPAIAVLRPVLEQCSDFLDWVEIDRVRNDLALAYFHAGNTQQCAATLRRTRASSHADEEALREGLPPCDFDNYVETARATWHNMRRCGVPAPREAAIPLSR